MRNLLIALSLILSVDSLFMPTAKGQIFLPPSKKVQDTSPPPAASTKEIIISELPRYPGARFVSGEEGKKGQFVRAAYSLEYAIPKSNETDVIPWYASALGSSGWKINQQTPTSIDAVNEKQNSHCNIFCDSYNDGYSMLQVHYVVMPQVDAGKQFNE